MAGATTDSGPEGSGVESKEAHEAFVDGMIDWKPGDPSNGIALVASEATALIKIVQQIPELKIPDHLWLGAINTEQLFSVPVLPQPQHGNIKFNWHQVPVGAAFYQALRLGDSSRAV